MYKHAPNASTCCGIALIFAAWHPGIWLVAVIMPNTSAMNVPRFVKLAPRIVTNLKIPIVSSVPLPAANAPKNVSKWLNKISFWRQWLLGNCKDGFSELGHMFFFLIH